MKKIIRKLKHPYHRCDWVVILKHEDGREIWDQIHENYQSAKKNLCQDILAYDKNNFQIRFLKQAYLRKLWAYYLKGEGPLPTDSW